MWVGLGNFKLEGGGMNILLAFGDGKFIRSKPARFRGELEIMLEKYHPFVFETINIYGNIFQPV